MQPGELVDGRFEVEGHAGSGGMGTVYRARDRASGEQIAVKILRSSVEAPERFARETRVLATLRHPHIVRYIADGRTAGGEHWLAMEWLEGEPLHHRLRRAPLSPAESIELVRRVAEALSAAHERGIVHRDIKPSNLMLPEGDLARVKILDFGVARITDARSTRTGVMVGTPGYMAPEQAKGEAGVGPRVDVFALGCVLFECLTGRTAFVGDNVMAVLAKILLEETPRLSDVRRDLPGELEELVGRTLAKRPEDRFADAAQLAVALARLGTLDAADLVPAPKSRPSLTETERRLLCVVLIGATKSRHHKVAEERTLLQTPATPDSDELAHTMPGANEGTLVVGSLREAATVHGASIERLLDGSYVATLGGSGDAADQATRAARLALALKKVAPAAPMALATGRGVMAGQWPVGEAIDRAARLLAAASPQVRVDEVTAGLLDTRFEVSGDSAGLFLVSERDLVEAARTVLGKATPCVGRDRELAVLHGLYDECVAEPIARAVLVTGAAGVGKTRVRYELVRRIKEHAAEIWIGRGDPLVAGSPYGIIAPALRRAAGIRDGEPVEVARQKLRARLSRHGAELGTTTWFVGELLGVPFPDEVGVELRAARQDPMLMTDQLRRAFEHFLTVETAAQPVVIVLEDLHWGDLPTVKLVDSALRELSDRPLFVVALARPEVHDMFPRLWADRGVQEVRLDELTKKGAEKLVRGVLAERANDALIAQIVERAGGNAFYLEELIRASAEGKGDALPETVLAVVQGRLERLEVDARRILRAASLFGHRFWKSGVAALIGDRGDEVVRAWLDTLVEREMILRVPVSRFPGEDELMFRNSLVREAAYAMLTEADRKLGHRLAGDWLERAGEPQPVVLAEHFERGGEPARALDHYRRAAEQALAACDFRTAVDRATSALACGATGEQSGTLHLIQAEALKWHGELSAAAEHGMKAMTLLPRGSGRWCHAAGEAAEGSGRVAQLDQLVSIGEALRDAPELPEALAERVSGTARAAWQLFSNGKTELALVLLDRVDRMAGSVDDPGILARVHAARAARAIFRGDNGELLMEEQAAADEFARAGDFRYECVQRGHVGYACLEIGAFGQAERYLRDALDFARRLGLANVAATVKQNLGRALERQGRLDEALATELEAIGELQAQGDRRLEAAARNYLAEILSQRGDLDGGEREVRHALTFATEPMKPQLLATLAQILLRRGRSQEALATALASHEIMDAIGAVEEGESLIRLTLVECLRASGDTTSAAEAARRAKTRLVARAEQIKDPEWRRMFLEHIPEHIRTLAL
jgi:serine/threonine protein kinase/tetratricopeptide (TPR) repeat protein